MGNRAGSQTWKYVLGGAALLLLIALVATSGGDMAAGMNRQSAGTVNDDQLIPFLPLLFEVPKYAEENKIFDLEGYQIKEVQYRPYKEVRELCMNDPFEKVKRGKELIIYELSIGNSGSSWQTKMLSLVGEMRGYYMPVTLVEKPRGAEWKGFENFVRELGYRVGDPLTYKEVKDDMLEFPDNFTAETPADEEDDDEDGENAYEEDPEDDADDAKEESEEVEQGKHFGTLLKVLEDIPMLNDEAHIKFCAFKFWKKWARRVNDNAIGACPCCFVYKPLLGDPEAEAAMIHMHAFSLGFEFTPQEVADVRRKLAMWLFEKYCFPGSLHGAACSLLDEYPEERGKFAYNDYEDFRPEDRV